jgi:hypothetical protein
VAIAGQAKSINLAAFQLIQEGTEFDGVVEGSLLPFLTTMKDKKMLAIIHTEGAYSGDVITLQTSVLHDREGSLGDYGLDCQLSFTEEKEDGETIYSLGGICHINRVGHGKSEKYMLVITPTPFPATTSDSEEWYLFDEDEDAKVGFYVNIGK